jgi:hypothetical protein
MSDVGPRAQSLLGEGPGRNRAFPVSDSGGGSIFNFDGIDWSGAAPTWISMIGGFSCQHSPQLRRLFCSTSRFAGYLDV